MSSLKHYPDKPWERSPADLAGWDDGNYICQQKTDGWRMEVLKGSGVINYISRHNKSMDNDVEDFIQEQMSLILEEAPERTQLDGEWLSRREATNKRSKPILVLFDVYRYNSRWLLTKTYQDRWALLQKMYRAAVDRHGIDAFPNVLLAETAADEEFVAFYETQKLLAHSEGVVVKHKASTLIGDRKTSKKNPRWYKVKYRGMSSGRGLLDHLH